MSKRKLLYIVFSLYMLLVFIPVNIMMYLPNLLPFTPSFFKTPEVTTSIQVASTINTQETSMSEDDVAPDTSTLFGNIAKPENLENRKSVAVKGAFDSCLNSNCDSVSLYSDSTFSKKDIFSLGNTTVTFCVNKEINGVDMTSYNIDFDIEDDLYTVIPLNKVASTLGSYAPKEPIQYEFVSGNLNWISIYLDNCDAIK